MAEDTPKAAAPDLPRALSGDELMKRLSRFGRRNIRAIHVIGKVGGVISRDMAEHPWKAALAVNPLTPGTELVVPALMVAHWAVSRRPEHKGKIEEIRKALSGRIDGARYREAITVSADGRHAAIDGWKLAKLVWADTKAWAGDMHRIGQQQVAALKDGVSRAGQSVRRLIVPAARDGR